METVIKDRIIQDTEEHNLLREHQHSFCNIIIQDTEEQNLLREYQHDFCKVKFCLANLSEFIEKVNKDDGNSDPVDFIHLDYFQMLWIRYLPKDP